MESRLVSSLTRCSWLVLVIDEERSSLEFTRVEPWSTHGRGYSVSKSLLFSGPHCLREIVLFFRLFLFFLFSKFLSFCALLFFLHFFFSASFYFRPNVSYFVFLLFFCSYVLLVFFVFVMFSSFPVSFLGRVLLVVVLLLMSLFFQLFFVLLFFLLFVYFSYLFLFSLNIRARLLRSLTD